MKAAGDRGVAPSHARVRFPTWIITDAMSHAVRAWTDHREFEREFGAALIPEQYMKFFRERIERGTWRKIPKGLKASFAQPRDDGERRLLELIKQGDADEISRL